jgi:hypothetical protein
MDCRSYRRLCADPTKDWLRCVTVPDLTEGKVVLGRPASAAVSAGIRDRLPGREVERFGMGPAVVLGEDLSEGTGPVRDGAVADLAAGDRKLDNGHGEAAGR